MVNLNANAIGIIFPNSYDSTVPELTAERSMASVPFAARYRLIDFALSNMVNGGIDNITILVRENYYSLMDHLGSGREWDLARKNGGLRTIPPFAYKNSRVYNGRVEALHNIRGFIEGCSEKYVVISDANAAANVDYKDVLNKHIESGADVTCLYATTKGPAKLPECFASGQEMLYTFKLDKDNNIKEIKVNPSLSKPVNLSMNIYVIDRELLMDLIDDAFINGSTFFERDILAKNVNKLNMKGYQYTNYAATFFSLQSYYAASMNLLKDNNLEKLFENNPIYTKIRDDTPTRYVKGSKVKNIMAADGCLIEGEVENCILFRGVTIKKGAKVKNCILMQDTYVGEGAEVDHVITDKNVTVSAGQNISGSDSFPVFVRKGQTV